jgi:nuclear transcription factor Y, alpha
MRRPRGPGGRFLTAEEIAAQKLVATDHPSPVDHDMDDDHLQLSPDPDLAPSSDPPPPAPPFIHQSLVNMEYHQHNLPISLSLHPQPKQPLYNPESLQQTHRHHSSMASPSESITLTAPYSRDKLHHVTPPHTHPRQQQSSFASYPSMYPDPDLQRHTGEMIMYTPGPAS